MNFLDPTYLRYVHDGLLTGALKKENESLLPNGLVGIYEDIFSNSITLLERKKLLDFFSVWALLKQGVSPNFVSDILSLKVEDALGFLSKHSKLFNYVNENKFVLYHQSLVAFILQYTSPEIIEKTIISLSNSNLIEAVEYSEIYLNDHYYSLSFINQKYSNKCIEFIDSISNNSIVKDHHFRAFVYVSEILNYRNDFKALKYLYTKYDKIINSPMSIKVEKNRFEHLGVDYLIKQGSLFSDPNITVLYLIYFIDFLLSKQSLSIYKKNIISILVKEVNEFLLLNSKIKNSLLTSKYVNHLNLKLLFYKIQKINYESIIEGIPWLMTESGHDDCILDDSDKYIFNDLSNLGFHIDDLVKRFEYIEFENLNYRGEVNKLIESLIQNDHSYCNKTLLNLKIKLLLNERKAYDNLYDFDDFIFRLYLVAININPNLDFRVWKNYFVTSHDFYEQNMSFHLMLRRISFNDKLENHYRTYLFNKNDLQYSHNYTIDEMSSVMYVLCLQNRAEEIKILLKKFIEEITFVNAYNFHIDLLASEYNKSKPNPKNIELIYNYFKINKVEYYELSSLLASHISFLDLISMQIYNSDEQSEINMNFNFAYNILDAIYEKLDHGEFVRYITDGFTKYISVMGSYELYEHKIADNLPIGNIWKIEWYIMCNFYASIIMNEKIVYSIKNQLIKAIENIFKNNNFNPEKNLFKGLIKYKSLRKIEPRKINQSFEFLFHSNEKHYLRDFKNLKSNNQIINKISGAIKNKTIHLF